MKLTFRLEDICEMVDKTPLNKIKRAWVKVNVTEIEKLRELWTEVNPREQNLKSRPAKAMRTTLLEDPRDIFHFLNRGIVITVSDYTVDLPRKEMTLLLKDSDLHGALDGGHTLKTILDTLDKIHEDNTKHVMLEVVSGVDEYIFDLARSRNTSTQVKEKSMANLEGKFEFISVALAETSFFKDIAWTENGPGKVNVAEIMQLLTAMNPTLPVQQVLKSYTSAASCEKIFINEFNSNSENQQRHNSFYRMSNVMRDIFELHDHIYLAIPFIHNENGYSSESGKFGLLTSVKTIERTLKFTQQVSKYEYPRPMYLPILSGLRHLLELNASTGQYEWVVPPITIFEDKGTEMVQRVMHYHLTNNGAVNKYGKDLAIWQDMENFIKPVIDQHKTNLEMESLRQKIAQLEGQRP